MKEIYTASPLRYNNSFDGINTLPKDSIHRANSSFIKHQLHEKKVDEFFWTDLEAPPKRFSPLALIGSIAGVLTPVLLIGHKKNPKIKLDSLKNIYQSTNFSYELPEILKVGCGGVIGGLIGGLLDKKEKGKLNKIEEATYQIMNITFPAVLVSGGIKLCEQNKITNKSPIKLLSSAIGMIIGVNAAVKASNKLDDVYFDKYNIDLDRKFKKKDLIVHVDDLIGSLVLAKIPLADKIHAEKLLPLIFTWSGFHVGES